MGNDGGSVLSRKDLVKLEKKGKTSSEIFEAKQLNSVDIWSKCAFSGELLRSPIVSDYRGKLYNKEAILEWLLSPQDFTPLQKDLISHVKSIRDVVPLEFSEENGQWVCPVTKKSIKEECSTVKFVYLVPCGHVFAESAIKNIPGNTCPSCDTNYEDSNVITINTFDGDEKQSLEKRMDQLVSQSLTHSLKPVKSTKKPKKVKKLQNAKATGKVSK
ncbi:hypothetical protein TRVA0_019S01970 [Trichomonascus vanleenenianus]|uniref:uncharacterized protein n=1 Tax=Trichomonascus vanleenenianus TaxID=2268995 RepID=UPI003ECAD13C